MAFYRRKKPIEVDTDYVECDRCYYQVTTKPRVQEVIDNQYPVGWGRISGIHPTTGMPVVMDLCDLCAPEVVVFIRNNPKVRAGSQDA